MKMSNLRHDAPAARWETTDVCRAGATMLPYICAYCSMSLLDLNHAFHGPFIAYYRVSIEIVYALFLILHNLRKKKQKTAVHATDGGFES